MPSPDHSVRHAFAMSPFGHCLFCLHFEALCATKPKFMTSHDLSWSLDNLVLPIGIIRKQKGETSQPDSIGREPDPDRLMLEGFLQDIHLSTGRTSTQVRED